MKKGQKSVRDGIQDFLCPFTDMFITQGSNGKYSHQGTMANDVRGLNPGVKYPIYAPCDCKCVRVIPSYGESRWQSLEKVRFANGRIDYATFEIVHDNSQDCYVGMIRKQGEQIANMGTKSPLNNVTGVHTHIQISQSNDTTYYKNKYGVYQFNNEYDTDDCYFMDGTNIMQNIPSAHWTYLKDVPVSEYVSGNYRCDANMNVRSGAGTDNPIKKVKELSEDGKNNAVSQNLDDNAIYKKGTVFTALEIINNDNGTWAKTPSGYVCIQGAYGTKYCSKI